VPRLCEFYPGICLTTEEKIRKNLNHGKKNLSQVKKTLIQSTVYILPKTTTHYKTLTNTLRVVGLYLVTDVSGLHIGPILHGQAIPACTVASSQIESMFGFQ
jgi:hypothetical protein